MNDDEIEALIVAVQGIATNLGHIAHGGASGPDGLELVSMAMSKDGDPSVAQALTFISGALEQVAHALHEVANKMPEQ